MGNSNGKFIGVVFGLFFAGGGIFFLSMTSLPLITSWWSARDWQPYQATLIRVSGRENSTAASYSYSVNGREYLGSRVYLADFSDNIGSYHIELQRYLQQHHSQGKPVRIWVDPHHPDQAVIDRSMRWGLFAFVSLFCSVFVFIGLFVSIASLLSKKTPSRSKRAANLGKLKQLWQQYRQTTDTPLSPQSFVDFARQQREILHREQLAENETTEGEAPWLNRKEWQGNGLCSEAGRGTAAIWFIAILWNCISTPVIFVLGEELKLGNWPAFIGLIFPMVGVFLLFRAVSTTLEYRKFGTVRCRLDPFPGSIGGHVGGYLDIPRKIDKNSSRFTIDLECVYTYVSGSGKNRSRREDIRWAETGTPQPLHSQQATRLMFRFDVPEDLPQSAWQQKGDYIFWRLRVHGSLRGIDLSRHYVIPVYPTSCHSENVHHDISKQMREEKKRRNEKLRFAVERGDFSQLGLGRMLSITRKERELHMQQPMFRNLSLSFFCLLFGTLFGGGLLFMGGLFSGGGFFSIFTALFALPFVLIGCLAFGCGLYLPFNSLHVILDRHAVAVMRKWLLIPVYFTELPSKEVESCQVHMNLSSGQGVKKRLFHAIRLHTKKGSTITIAEGIEGYDRAVMLRDYLQERIRAGY